MCNTLSLMLSLCVIFHVTLIGILRVSALRSCGVLLYVVDILPGNVLCSVNV